MNDVKCNVPLETKWNKTQPRVVLRGFAKEINIINQIAYIK